MWDWNIMSDRKSHDGSGRGHVSLSLMFDLLLISCCFQHFSFLFLRFQDTHLSSQSLLEIEYK